MAKEEIHIVEKEKIDAKWTYFIEIDFSSHLPRFIASSSEGLHVTSRSFRWGVALLVARRYINIHNVDRRFFHPTLQCEHPERLVDREEVVATVVYVKHTHKVFVDREWVGKYPIYHHCSNRKLVLSNRLDTLLERTYEPATFSIESLILFFSFGFIPAPHSVFKDCYKIPSGASICWDLTSYRISLNHAPLIPVISETEPNAAEELENTLRSTITRELSDGKKGPVLLSGGLDSSLLAAMMAPLTNGDLETLIFFDTNDDEIRQAGRFARRIHSTHRKIKAPAWELGYLSDVLFNMDEPNADTMCFPLAYLMEKISGQSGYCWSSIGADDMFCSLYEHIALHIWAGKTEECCILDNLKNEKARTVIAQKLRSLNDSRNIYESLANAFARVSCEDINAVLYPETSTERINAIRTNFIRNWLNKSDVPKEEAMRFSAKIRLPEQTMPVILAAERMSNVEHISPFTNKEIFFLSNRLSSENLVREGLGKLPVRDLGRRVLGSSEYRKTAHGGFSFSLVKFMEANGDLKELFENMDAPFIHMKTSRQWNRTFHQANGVDRFRYMTRLWFLLVWYLWSCRFITPKTTRRNGMIENISEGLR